MFCVSESPPPPYSRLTPSDGHKPLGESTTTAVSYLTHRGPTHCAFRSNKVCLGSLIWFSTLFSSHYSVSHCLNVRIDWRLPFFVAVSSVNEYLTFKATYDIHSHVTTTKKLLAWVLRWVVLWLYSPCTFLEGTWHPNRCTPLWEMDKRTHSYMEWRSWMSLLCFALVVDLSDSTLSYTEAVEPHSPHFTPRDVTGERLTDNLLTSPPGCCAQHIIGLE